MDISEKENIEINYWKESSFESPDAFTKSNLLNKLQECRHFDYKVRKYKNIFRNKKSVLEIGAGQGWASCFLKKYFIPNANFTVTDISPHAIEGLKKWERLFEVKIDSSFSSKSYNIEAEDNSFDLIFCYAAAHHFVLHKETLIELKRLLKPKGHIVYLFEPTCSKLFYPLHYYYVNKVAHSTPEDVLVPSEIKSIAKKINLKYTNHYDPVQTIIRNIPIGLYFQFLKTFKFLQQLLPSSSDLIFTKEQHKP